MESINKYFLINIRGSYHQPLMSIVVEIQYFILFCDWGNMIYATCLKRWSYFLIDVVAIWLWHILLICIIKLSFWMLFLFVIEDLHKIFTNFNYKIYSIIYFL